MTAKTRINAIDTLRGLVMIIMALDHTRDFFHAPAGIQDPLDLATTTPFLFFTRWITHFCAPVFVFLSGSSAYLQGLRKDRKTLSRFLITRGLWLCVAELLIITFALTFDVTYSLLILQVIWAIGASMIVLGILVWLPYWLLFTVGIVIVFGHNLLDIAEAGEAATMPLWYKFMHVQSFVPLGGQKALLIVYPVLPWIGVMILGYCFGRILTQDVARRNKDLIRIGLVAILTFIILRSFNIYGDPLPWSPQKTTLYSLLSFLNTQKYPPSLLYLCMTLGPALVLMGLLGEAQNKTTKIIAVYGSVPFFYYIIHFFIIHALAAAFYLMRGHSVAEGLAGTPNNTFKFVQPGEGFGLAGTYLVWIVIVAVLYPVCKWYSNYKKTHGQWWLSYL